MDLNTPRKEAAQPTLLAKLKASGEDKTTLATKPVVVEEVNKEQALEEYRKRFVGDLDCEEKDEPLLQETTARFVLFPIKYREVSLLCYPVDWVLMIRSGKCTSRLRHREFLTTSSEL